MATKSEMENQDEFADSLMPKSLRIDIPLQGVSIYTLRVIFEDLLPRLCTYSAEKTREQIPDRYIKQDILGACHIARDRIREMKAHRRA